MDEQPTVKQIDESTGNDATLLLRIEEMIKTHIAQIDQLDDEIAKHKGMLDDTFVNDEVFQQHDKAAKEASKIRAATKAQIMKRPDIAHLSSKLKELKTEKSELSEGLSSYLQEYQRISGSNEIEGEDGEVREIIYVAKLVKKSSKYRP